MPGDLKMPPTRLKHLVGLKKAPKCAPPSCSLSVVFFACQEPDDPMTIGN